MAKTFASVAVDGVYRCLFVRFVIGDTTLQRDPLFVENARFVLRKSDA